MMLKPDAFIFSKALLDLWLTESICEKSAWLQMDDAQILDTRQGVDTLLEEIARICADTDLSDHIGPELLRFKTALRDEGFEGIARRCDHLRERILDELAKELYFHIPREDSQYYGKERLLAAL